MRIGLLLLLIGITSFSFAQTGKPKVPSYFGVQIKPILPTQFIGNPTLTQEKEGFKTVMTQRVGYSFGGVVRVGLTKLIALETGINFNQRTFGIDMSMKDSTAIVSNRMSFVTYDIPVKALIYIRLADKWFMNTAVGADIAYNPTNVGVKTIATGNDAFQHTGFGRKVNFEFNASVGFEFRTEKNGFFYLGGTGAVPFFPIFYLRSEYQYGGVPQIRTDAEANGKVDGSYLAIEFKYFLPVVKSKGSKFQPGPIE